MNGVQPIFIDCALQRMLRTEADAAMIVGRELAPGLLRLIDVARQHHHDIHIAVLSNGCKETLVARVASASGEWQCVR